MPRSAPVPLHVREQSQRCSDPPASRAPHARSPAVSKAPRRRLSRQDAIFLELYGGEGGVTKAVMWRRISCGPAFELKRGPEFDLTLPHVRAVITRWLSAGRVFCIWFGTPCGRWSVARSSASMLFSDKLATILSQSLSEYVWDAGLCQISVEYCF